MTGEWAEAHTTTTSSASHTLAHPLDRLSTVLLSVAALYLVMSAVGAFEDWMSPPVRQVVGTTVGLFPLALLAVGGLWFTLAGRNLDAMAVRGRFWWSGWGFLAWVIPVANLILPYLYTRELWKASEPTAGRSDWQTTPVPAWLTVWWVLWALQTVLPLGRVLTGFFLTRLGAGQDGAQVFLVLKALNVVVLAASLVFFGHLLRTLAERQRQKVERLPPATAFGEAGMPEGPVP